MPNFAPLLLGATICCVMVLMAPHGSEALPIGAKSQPRTQGVILAKRECIAWERTPNGGSKCVRWAECKGNIC